MNEIALNRHIDTCCTTVVPGASFSEIRFNLNCPAHYPGNWTGLFETFNCISSHHKYCKFRTRQHRPRFCRFNLNNFELFHRHKWKVCYIPHCFEEKFITPSLFNLVSSVERYAIWLLQQLFSFILTGSALSRCVNFPQRITFLPFFYSLTILVKRRLRNCGSSDLPNSNWLIRVCDLVLLRHRCASAIDAIKDWTS